MGYIYIGDEYKDMISKSFNYVLTNGDFYLSNFNNQQLRITNVVKKYRWEKNIDVDCLISRNSLKTW